LQADGRVLEDGSHLHRELLLAFAAFPPLLSGQVVRFFGMALGANSLTIGPFHSSHGINANLLIAEILYCFE
jgi:hypothetical protein